VFLFRDEAKGTFHYLIHSVMFEYRKLIAVFFALSVFAALKPVTFEIK